jgi:hypothetical protein
MHAAVFRFFMLFIDPQPTLADLAAANKQVRFGLARGLTQVAKDASAAVKQSMPTRLDRPTPFTLAGPAIQPATRDNLQSMVLIKDVQAAYLLLEETGGERSPQRGSPINIPVDQRTNAYGNIPRGTIARLRQRSDVFVSSGAGRAAKLPPGIYQRAKATKRGAAKGPKLLIAFERAARYQPRLNFRATVVDLVSRTGLDTIAKSIASAFDTARP